MITVISFQSIWFPRRTSSRSGDWVSHNRGAANGKLRGWNRPQLSSEKHRFWLRLIFFSGRKSVRIISRQWKPAPWNVAHWKEEEGQLKGKKTNTKKMAVREKRNGEKRNLALASSFFFLLSFFLSFSPRDKRTKGRTLGGQPAPTMKKSNKSYGSGELKVAVVGHSECVSRTVNLFIGRACGLISRWNSLPAAAA